MAKTTRFAWRGRDIGISEPLRHVIAAIALLLVATFAADGSAAEGGGKDANDFIRLAPIQVPIIVNRRVVGQAGVLVQLQLADAGDFDAIDKQRPKLLDAFLSELYGLFDQLENAPHVVEPTIVKQHLQRVADRILGAGKIREVVILRTYEKRDHP